MRIQENKFPHTRSILLVQQEYEVSGYTVVQLLLLTVTSSYYPSHTFWNTEIALVLCIRFGGAANLAGEKHLTQPKLAVYEVVNGRRKLL